jgi:hypothetical protein
VWRAANGINPQDPRPTGGGGELDTAAALWKLKLPPKRGGIDYKESHAREAEEVRR